MAVKAKHEHQAPNWKQRLGTWWTGPERLKNANVEISYTGVLSKPSRDILASKEAGRQLDSFVEIYEQRKQKA